MHNNNSIQGYSIAAVLFDMDGVVTDTAEAHFHAWKHVFDGFLTQQAANRESDQKASRPFTADDYRDHVDGKSRLDGIRAFLGARQLAVGDAAIEMLADRKNSAFQNWLSSNRVQTYDGSVELFHGLRAQHLPFAVFTASKNAERVLESAGIRDLIAVLVDGHVAATRGLRGKPAPDTLLEAASMLGVEPSHTAVLEDAYAGVEAARAGGFEPIIGIAHGRKHDHFFDHGAHLVVDDPTELALFPAARLGSHRNGT
ncbi:MAG: beta-phosphoglucomutase family hydrolase [Pseudomonadota bacterium]